LKLFHRKSPTRQAPPAGRRIRELELLSAKLVRGGLAGRYHAAFHGQGIEFAQVREYQPGDDVRTLDWNVTARSGVPHVKQFVEERNLSVLVMLDASSSMRFGSLMKSKSEVAMELLSIFSFAALANGDRIGLILFDERVRLYREPSRSRTATLRMLRETVERYGSCGGRTNLAQAAEFARRVLRRRAVVVVVSDFLEVDPYEALRPIASGHDVVALQLVDPREERFPQRGLVRLFDLETGLAKDVDLAARRPPLESLRWRSSTDRALRGLHIDRLEISTASDYDQSLLRFFNDRAARRYGRVGS